MLNRAPFNTEVPQFLPSRDAPINSYIIRKYPCQEHLAGKTNTFGSLTWKIQQPDSSMVWQSVKLVLPMEIECLTERGTEADMNVYSRLPTCNVALSQSPMNAFRQTTLTLNGRIFSEENSFRDTLDACYRGVGAQAYGDNHSLKPIVVRTLKSSTEGDRLQLYNSNGAPYHGYHVNTDRLESRTLTGAFSLLEHNGPFIERARLWQDNLSFDGSKWNGEISHLLEIGPFQARARKGNTAVPYIQDFHLRLNYQNNAAKFDNLNGLKTYFAGKRTMAPKLLEFATIPNFLHHTEVLDNEHGWANAFNFTYTAQPYLEVTYTKHEGPMRPEYHLRCFEHIYEQGPRFNLQTPENSFVSPSSLQRVTTRLLSLPTKIYVWAEPADEYKHPFIFGGVRRSCELNNIHLRVNQRPDVMFNPSQEECYDMFKRHTNSSLEYGSWKKSPIYCFDMVDVGQPDMFSNDARISWFEWDAEVKLTPLQITEQTNINDANLDATGYVKGANDIQDNFKVLSDLESPGEHVFGLIDVVRQPRIVQNQKSLRFQLVVPHDPAGYGRSSVITDGALMKNVNVRLVQRAWDTHTTSDFTITAVEDSYLRMDGYIWARVATQTIGNVEKGDIKANAFFYVPQSHRFGPDHVGAAFLSNLNDLTFSGGKIHFTHRETDVNAPKGTFYDNSYVRDLNGESFGDPGNGTAKWAPGPYGYAISGAGIDNSVLYGWDVDNGLAPLPKVDESVAGVKWVCFAPTTVMPSQDGHHAWHTNLLHSIDRTGMDNQHAPEHWNAQIAGVSSEWNNGNEVICCETAGVWGRKDPERFNTTTVFVDATAPSPYGVQLVRNTEVMGEWARDTEYRLKALYEYGNCQYSFRQDAAPTRILPNVVPVGPSAGIPSL